MTDELTLGVDRPLSVGSACDRDRIGRKALGTEAVSALRNVSSISPRLPDTAPFLAHRHLSSSTRIGAEGTAERAVTEIVKSTKADGAKVAAQIAEDQMVAKCRNLFVIRQLLGHRERIGVPPPLCNIHLATFVQPPRGERT